MGNGDVAPQNTCWHRCVQNLYHMHVQYLHIHLYTICIYFCRILCTYIKKK